MNRESLDYWYNVLFLMPFGVLLAVGSINFHRSQSRMMSTVPVVWGIPLLVTFGATTCLPAGVATAGEDAHGSSVQTTESTEQDLRAALAGKWVARSIDGTAVEEPVTIEFRGDEVDNLFHDAEGRWHVLNFRVFPHELGPAIDVWGEETPLHGILTQRGIFQIDGEVLTIVFRPKLDARQRSPWVDDEGRPTTFDPEHVVTRVFERPDVAAAER